MWPFKRKKIEKETQPKTVNTVLCIPVSWSSPDRDSSLILEQTNGEYMVIGNILMSVKYGRHYTIQCFERDHRMYESFKYAGMATGITQEVLSEIDKHTYVVYISGQTGSLIEAEHIARAGSAILKSGGLGMKIDSTGKAFEKDKWLQFLENFQEPTLYEMFVIDSILAQDGSVYSCGMHNIGLRDTVVSGEEFQNAVDLISVFGYYQIIDKPTIKNNQTFSADIESPLYRITDEPNQPYIGDELFENPFGMWRLSRIE